MTALGFIPAKFDEFVVALAWHDVVCVAGPECRTRDLHALAEPITLAGYPQRFLERLGDLLKPGPISPQDMPDRHKC